MSYTAKSMFHWLNVLNDRRQMWLDGSLVLSAEAHVRDLAAALIAGEYRA